MQRIISRCGIADQVYSDLGRRAEYEALTEAGKDESSIREHTVLLNCVKRKERGRS